MLQIKYASDGLVQIVNYSDTPIEGFTQISEIPKPEEREGKYPVMYYRNGKIEYEYLDIPEISEEDPEQKLAEAKDAKIAEIDAYDKSKAVEQFYLNEVPMWYPATKRTTIKNLVNSSIIEGRDTITLWTEEEPIVPITISCDLALQLLAKLEVYAGDALANTQKHKAAVQALTSIEEVQSYDYKTGYPEKLKLTF